MRRLQNYDAGFHVHGRAAAGQQRGGPDFGDNAPTECHISPSTVLGLVFGTQNRYQKLGFAANVFKVFPKKRR